MTSPALPLQYTREQSIEQEATCDECSYSGQTFTHIDGKHLCGPCLDNLDPCVCAQCRHS